MPIFRVKSVNIYTSQKKFTRACSWRSWQISGMSWLFRIHWLSHQQEVARFLWMLSLKLILLRFAGSLVLKKLNSQNSLEPGEELGLSLEPMFLQGQVVGNELWTLRIITLGNWNGLIGWGAARLAKWLQNARLTPVLLQLMESHLVRSSSAI